jgi:hypothetical protein
MRQPRSQDAEPAAARTRVPGAAWVLLALAAVVSFTPACANAAPGTPTVPVLSAVNSSLTVNGTTKLNGPVTVQMDTTHAGVTIRGRQGSLAQPIAVYDYLGNPIFHVGSDGGAGVTGDDFKVFPPGDVFNASITLHKHGSITIGGVHGPTLYGGGGDPNVSSPCVDQPCAPGDRYLHIDGRTLVFLGGVWTVK